MPELELDLNKIILFLGERGSGKTDYVKGNPQHNLAGFFKYYIEQRKMKVLIVQTIDHPSYRDIPFIPQDMLKSWQAGVYRILVNRRFINEFCLFLDGLKSMWNVFILFEDAATHTKLRLCDGMNDILINSKQKNNDVGFMYHSWMQVPDALYGLIDIIELFKVKSSPKKREMSMPGYYEIACETWQKVLADPNPFAHKMILTGN